MNMTAGERNSQPAFPFSALFGRRNPVLYKEWRQLCNQSMPAVLAAAQLAIEVCFFIVGNLFSFDDDGLCSFYVFFTFGIIAMSALPVLSSTANQRCADGLEPLWGTRVTVGQLIAGKMLTVLALDLFVLLLASPFLLMAAKNLSWMWQALMLCIVLAVQYCSLAASFFRPPWLQLPHIWLVPFCAVVPVVFSAAVNGDGKADLTMECFLTGFADCASVVFLAVCFSVSFLRHAALNRAAPIRLGVIAAVIFWFFRSHISMDSSLSAFTTLFRQWYIPSLLLVCAVMLVSSMETLQCSRRFRRALPAKAFLRFPVSLILPGAGNGALFCLLSSLLCTAAFTVYDRLFLCGGTDSFCTIVLGAGMVPYALFYSGVIMMIRLFFPDFRLNAVLVVMVMMVVNVVCSVLAGLVELPSIAYFSPVYVVLRYFAVENDSWEALCDFTLKMAPLMVCGLLMLLVALHRYWRGVKERSSGS